MIKKFSAIEDRLNALRKEGLIRGEQTGFKQLDELYSIKEGSYTFILGAPHSGKSEFCFELIINQAQRYGKRSLIYSPETGSVEQIYAELIHKKVGKKIYLSGDYFCSDDEYMEAVEWVDKYFDIVDTDDKSFSLNELYELCTDCSIIFADPYNELSHDMSKYGTRQDLYIEDLIGSMRRFTSKKKKHVILTLHPSVQMMQEDKDSKVMYYPMPTARQAAGGQSLFRKAMTWINIWRPPISLFNADGQPYKDNELLVTIEKAKPKGVSTRGTMSIFFDWKRNRYYEVIDGYNKYAFEHEMNIDRFEMPRSSEFEDLF